MRKLNTFSATALLIAVFLTGCNGLETSEPIDSYLYKEPVELQFEISCRIMTDFGDQVEVGVDGVLSNVRIEGRTEPPPCPQPIYVVPPQPRPELTPEQLDYLANLTLVSVNREAAYIDVVRALRKLSSEESIILINDGLSRFFETDETITQERFPLAFESLPEERLMSVFVAYEDDNDGCVYISDQRSVSSDDLYTQAYATLDQFVKETGGADAIASDQALLERATVSIRADAKTPWHCVSGADYQLRAAGLPRLLFEVMPDEVSPN